VTRPNATHGYDTRSSPRAGAEQGVSLNGFINATIAAAVAQQETLTFFSDRLRDVDQEALHNRVLKFMRKTRPGKEPSIDEIERAMRG